jgi:hypothetical protein
MSDRWPECSICGHRLHLCSKHGDCPGWHHTASGFDPLDHVATMGDSDGA